MSKVTAFVVGDPHFKANSISRGKEFVEKLVEAIEKAKPTFIVLLGDTLDTHEIVKIFPHQLAHDLIERLRKIAPTFVLIGNHDLINASQYLTTNHIFNPFKKWKNVRIVDKPLIHNFGEFTFVFCPYVPPGRFKEALDTLIGDDNLWEFADCIFAHQEFKGCFLGRGIQSEKGDEWKEEYPPVISGHIHSEQQVGKNVHYIGSPVQHTYSEDSNKYVWEVTFEKEKQFSVNKISLGIRQKKTYKTTIKNLEKFNPEKHKKKDVKLVVLGTRDELSAFRKSQKYKELCSYDNIIVRFEIVREETSSENTNQKSSNYIHIFKEMVSAQPPHVKEAFEELNFA